MVTLRNPSDNDVSIVYLGKPYSIGAEAAGVFPDDVADFWKGIHQFLVVESTEVIAPVVSKKVEVEEVQELEEKEEVEDEAPIAPTPKKGGKSR